MKHIIITILTGLICLGIIGYMMYLRFTNPDMTDVRLWLTYWKTLLPCIGVMLALGISLAIYVGRHK